MGHSPSRQPDRWPIPRAAATREKEQGSRPTRRFGKPCRSWATRFVFVNWLELRIPRADLLGGSSETTSETRHVYSSRPTALRASRCVPNHSTQMMDPFRKVQTPAPRCSKGAPLPVPRATVRWLIPTETRGWSRKSRPGSPAGSEAADTAFASTADKADLNTRKPAGRDGSSMWRPVHARQGASAGCPV